MLAERKQKQRWSLNPRGKAWSEDSNKFGQRILERMGWKHGKGLGANEDGIKEHVKISYKNDSQGIGYKENEEAWTEHGENFTQLLNSLSQSTDSPCTKSVSDKPKSLEEKSQNSRVRVHYHKFTKGKDLSRYSEKDLANIFGKKTLKPSHNVIHSDVKVENKNLVHKGSIADYFKNKLPQFTTKNNGCTIGSNEVSDRTCPSDSETGYRGFGFVVKEECVTKEELEHDKSSHDSTPNNGAKENESTEKKRKKSKKRKFEETVNSDNNFVSYLHQEYYREGVNVCVKDVANAGSVSQEFQQKQGKAKSGKKCKETFSCYLQEETLKFEENKKLDIENKSKSKKKKSKVEITDDLLQEVEQKGKEKCNESNLNNVGLDVGRNMDSNGSLENGYENCVGMDIVTNRKAVKKSTENSKILDRKAPAEVNKSKPKKKKVVNAQQIDEADLPTDNKQRSSKSKNNKPRGNIETELHEINEAVNNKEKYEKQTRKRKGEILENETASDVCPKNIKKKRKKSNDKHDGEENLGVSNPAFDPMYTNVTIEKHILDTIEENEEASEIFETAEKETPENCNRSSSKSKTKVSKTKLIKNKQNAASSSECVMGIDNPLCDEQCSSQSVIETSPLNPYEVKIKRKKRSKTEDFALDQLSKDAELLKAALGTESSETAENTHGKPLENYNRSSNKSKTEVSKTKLSRNKQNAVSSSECVMGIDNPLCDEQCSSRSVIDNSPLNPYEVKIKRKKRSKTEDFALDQLSKDAELLKAALGTESLETAQNTFGKPLENFNRSSNKSKTKAKLSRNKQNAVSSSADVIGVDNPLFHEQCNGSVIETSSLNPYEVEIKRKKKSKTKNFALEKLSKDAEPFEEVLGIDNPLFEDQNNGPVLESTSENPYEVKTKKKKKKSKTEDFALDNPTFTLNSNYEDGIQRVDEANGENLQVKRKSRKQKNKGGEGVHNLGLNLSDSVIEGTDITALDKSSESIQIDDNLILNVVSLPVITPQKTAASTPEPSSAKGKRRERKTRKSVTFSNVTETRTIPRTYDQNLSPDHISNRNELFDINTKVIEDGLKKELKNGLDNVCFDRRANNMEENIESISKTLDMFQSEVENEINEAKIKSNLRNECMVGEIGVPSENHEKLEDGTRLSFKNAALRTLPFWMNRNVDVISAKKSYRHLIKGDIIVKFRNTNLHEISGYATKTSDSSNTHFDTSSTVMP